MADENGNGIDLSSLGSFDFTPAWAKKDEKVSIGGIRPERGDRDSGDGERRRPEQGQRKPFQAKKPFDRKPSGERRPRFEERPRPLDCEVKILPEPKALGTIFRKLQNDSHAFKLKELAYFFLDNPESTLLKITPRVQQDGQSKQMFYQCKACGFAALRMEDVVEHALNVHLADYYDCREIECEPPKGNFNCVAKCGLSGVLLGPPNIHEFNSTVREMIRTRYPDMSEEQYRAHIEMVRDADAIEEWRKGATKRMAFFAKSAASSGEGGDEAPIPLSREQAEGEFKRAILPSIVDTPKHLMITADMAAKSPSKPLAWAAKDAVEAERMAPYNMCFALRGAFHHRKMKFFRANDSRGPEFVTSVEYKTFDSAHAIPELAFAADFVAANPCCDKSEFPKDVADFDKHIAWLVSTGHIVAFTNGVYSAVEKFPKYGPQWKKRAKKQVETTEPQTTESEQQKDETPTQLAE